MGGRDPLSEYSPPLSYSKSRNEAQQLKNIRQCSSPNLLEPESHVAEMSAAHGVGWRARPSLLPLAVRLSRSACAPTSPCFTTTQEGRAGKGPRSEEGQPGQRGPSGGQR